MTFNTPKAVGGKGGLIYADISSTSQIDMVTVSISTASSGLDGGLVYYKGSSIDFNAQTLTVSNT